MMPRTFTVTVRDQKFSVEAGSRLLDAALRAGVELPHDCRAGQCGACMVELTRGMSLGGEAGCGNILACQARVFSDLEIATHDAPAPVMRNAVVEEVAEIARDVVQVVLRPRRPMDWRPGQYMKLQFRGYPPRSFSPSANLADGAFDDRMVFHIKKVRGGLVTPLLGEEIGAGSKLKIEGPFGHAFLRDDHRGRIILLGSGTGFAPVWAIASAAQKAAPERPILLICGAKDVDSFYMEDALRKAVSYRGTSVRVVLETPLPAPTKMRFGTPAEHMPTLRADDVVFAAGGPRMVENARKRAEIAGARFYADPFSPSGPARHSTFGTLDRVARAFRRAG